MKERVGDLVGNRARAMWVSTFHSMCVRILRAEAGQLGMKSTFTIYDPPIRSGWRSWSPAG